MLQTDMDYIPENDMDYMRSVQRLTRKIVKSWEDSWCTRRPENIKIYHWDGRGSGVI